MSAPLHTNLVLLVDVGQQLHHDTRFHLGVDVGTKDAVVAAEHGARAAGFHVEKPARTTWRGTPLHELWSKDPSMEPVALT